MFSSKFNEMDDINSDIGVLALTCLKLCIYGDLIEKIRNFKKNIKLNIALLIKIKFIVLVRLEIFVI